MALNRFVQSGAMKHNINNQNWKTRDPEREMQPTNTKRKSRLHPWSYKKWSMLQSAVLFRILNNRQRNDRLRVVLERPQVGLSKEEQPASTRYVEHSACKNFTVFRARDGLAMASLLLCPQYHWGWFDRPFSHASAPT